MIDYRSKVKAQAPASGRARALMCRAEEALLALGCPKVELMVRDSNEGAAAFHRAQGYADEHARVLSKRLASDE